MSDTQQTASLEVARRQIFTYTTPAGEVYTYDSGELPVTFAPGTELTDRAIDPDVAEALIQQEQATIADLKLPITKKIERNKRIGGYLASVYIGNIFVSASAESTSSPEPFWLAKTAVSALGIAATEFHIWFRRKDARTNINKAQNRIVDINANTAR